MIKFFSCFLAAGLYSIAGAQNKASMPSYTTPELLDTANMYASRYGKVARLTQDNMPCILPYDHSVPMPNAGRGQSTPGQIPNLWKRKKLPHSGKVPPATPYRWPYNKDSAPYFWFKDSAKIKAPGG